MKTQDIKTIDVLTKTWFDRANGNTYFAQRITLNFGMDNETEFINPFQYGYSSFEYFALKAIQKQIPDFSFPGTYELREAGIIFRHNKYKNCKQRELKNIQVFRLFFD